MGCGVRGLFCFYHWGFLYCDNCSCVWILLLCVMIFNLLVRTKMCYAICHPVKKTQWNIAHCVASETHNQRATSRACIEVAVKTEMSSCKSCTVWYAFQKPWPIPKKACFLLVTCMWSNYFYKLQGVLRQILDWAKFLQLHWLTPAEDLLHNYLIFP